MNCQTCQSPLRQIPAGVSKKTGKSYNAFMACPNKCKQPYGVTPNIPTPQPPTPPVKTDTMTKADWDKKSFGMCKHAFLVEIFKKHIEDALSDGDTSVIERKAEQWAEMSMRILPKQEKINTPADNIDEAMENSLQEAPSIPF